jgi:hypothetical protein
MINFSGKGDEWPICSETFLAKAKRYRFKDLFLGNQSLIKTDDRFDEVSDIGKKMVIIIKLNEIAFIELEFFINVKTNYSKILLIIFIYTVQEQGLS